MRPSSSRAPARRREAIVVFSGDGGFNEALNGLEGDTPIAFLPGGGTSVLPRALGLPPDPVAAARQVAEALEHNRTRRITVGRVNGRRFAFSAGVGLDAAAVRRVDEMGRAQDGKRPGDIAFALAIVRVLAAQRGPPRAGARGEGLRTRGVSRSSRTPTRTRTRRACRCAIAPEAEFELGPRHRGARAHPAALVASHGVQRPHRPSARRRCSTRTTPTGSRSCATGRCRCRSTARISATSRAATFEAERGAVTVLA